MSALPDEGWAPIDEAAAREAPAESASTDIPTDDPRFWADFDDEAGKLDQSNPRNIIGGLEAQATKRQEAEEAEEAREAGYEKPAPPPQPLSSGRSSLVRVLERSEHRGVHAERPRSLEHRPATHQPPTAEPTSAEELRRNLEIATQSFLLSETSTHSMAQDVEIIADEALSDYDLGEREPRDIANELLTVAPEALSEFLDIWRDDDPQEVAGWQNQQMVGEQMKEQIRVANAHAKATQRQRQEQSAMKAEISESFNDFVSEHPDFVRYGAEIQALMERNPPDGITDGEGMDVYVGRLYLTAKELNRVEGEHAFLEQYDEWEPLSTKQFRVEMEYEPQTPIELVRLQNLVPKPDPEVALLRGFDAEQDRKGAVDAWFGDVRENARRGADKRARAKRW